MNFLTDNLILKTDSYKASHWMQYPPKTKRVFSYFESRGGKFSSTVFFGLLYYLEQLTKGISVEDIAEAKEFFIPHGLPFNEEGWMYIAKELGGRLPLKIRAVPEGTVVPTHNVLFTVENTDEKCFWLTSYVETLLSRVWYPMTVATLSWHMRQTIEKFLIETSGSNDGIDFKLHDFGARGVSSAESAALGGAAHLINFMGTDTVEGVMLARKLYGEKMAGFSIAASEHSSITTWGKDRELDAYRNMVDKFARPGQIFACVSDSYDIDNAISNMWGRILKDEIIKKGATLVVRPDSGDPIAGSLNAVERLADNFGYTINSKGFKVLNNVRVIWGDGVNQESVFKILQALKNSQWSIENIAFGMGGALLQKVNRDTQKCAYKASWAVTDQGPVPVFKDPTGDASKKSKPGRVDLVNLGGKISTVFDDAPHGSILKTVFENGKIIKRDTFAEIRERAKL